MEILSFCWLLTLLGFNTSKALKFDTCSSLMTYRLVINNIHYPDGASEYSTSHLRCCSQAVTAWTRVPPKYRELCKWSRTHWLSLCIMLNLFHLVPFLNVLVSVWPHSCPFQAPPLCNCSIIYISKYRRYTCALYTVEQTMRRRVCLAIHVFTWSWAGQHRGGG